MTSSPEFTEFGPWVEQYRRGAMAYACTLCPSEAAAADAVQDAFLDAFVHWSQLRNPAAFGGWFRRIVFKHCDRQRRRWREVSVADPRERAGAGESAAAPEEGLEWRQLRRAVDALPEGQRAAVALHYFAGLSVRETAEFLEVGESAIKKRLVSARSKIARTTHVEPAFMGRRDAALAITSGVELFLAVHAGDAEKVRSLAARNPRCVNEAARWPDELALSGGFPLAHPVPPLVRAAAFGHEAVVEVLLEAGAAVSGNCSCDNGEGSLWVAERAGHAGIIERLRRAGARPGTRPLEPLRHWRAKSDAPPDASAADDRFRPDESGAFCTGIRAVDLCVPLRRHDITRVEGAAETGLMVLLAELTWLVSRAGGRAVWSSWAPQPWLVHELREVAARHGVGRWVDMAVPAAGAASEPESVLPAATARCHQLRAERPFVLHIVFEQRGHAQDVVAALPWLRGAADWTLIVRPWTDVTLGAPADDSYLAAFDSTLVTDPDQAGREIWPAIDRGASGRRDEISHPEATAIRDLVDTRRDRLEALLTQPFHAVTPDTGWPGVSVPLAETLAEVRALLRGDLDETPADSLRYRWSE